MPRNPLLVIAGLAFAVILAVGWVKILDQIPSPAACTSRCIEVMDTPDSRLHRRQCFCRASGCSPWVQVPEDRAP